MLSVGGPLLQVRLVVPPPRRHTVRRVRLLDRLSADDSPVILLSAPAGFGKTTLLASWCHQLAAADDVAVAWLTLDPGDNDPLRFLAYLRATLGAAAGATGPAASLPSAVEPALTMLLNALAERRRPLVLVLDDYHVIHAPAVHMAVAFLLEHVPPQTRLVLSGRADPPLPLARLRARGQLAELRAAELRYTSAELQAFFAQSGLSLPPDELAAVGASIEGWPAGAQLVALTKRSADAAPAGDERERLEAAGPRAGLAGSQSHLFAYLAEEVFAGQPAHRKAFLLQTAILDQLCGPLCDALLDVAPAAGADSYSRLVLDELDHANLFVVPLDGERRWFRYHQLFRAFLQERLERERPDDLAALHRRASAWYARHGQTAPAVQHALAGGDVGVAAELIVAAAVDTVARGEYETLAAWLAAMPEGARDERPALWLWAAWAALLGGAVEQVEPALDRAEAAWRGEGRRRERGEVAHLRAHLARLRGDAPAAIAAAQRALADLGPDQLTLRAGSLLALGAGQLLAGELGRAGETLEAALEACRAHNFLGSLVALRCLGDLEARRGRPEQAAAHYEAVLAVGKGRSLWECCEAELALAELRRARGDLDGALALLQSALDAAERAGVGVYMVEGYLTLARVRAARGDMPAAESALRRAHRDAQRLGARPLEQLVDQYRLRLPLAAGGAAEKPLPPAAAGYVSLAEPLSEREHEVLRLVAAGASNQAIAEALVISLGTVKSHLNHILGKLDARSRTEAVARARAASLIE